MFAGVNVLTQNLNNLPYSSDSIQAATNLVNLIGDYSDQMQAGPTGKAGIFKYNRPVVIPLIAALPPTQSQSWIPLFASAIHMGSTEAILSPGTVSFAGWVVSIQDIAPPIITTLSAAKPLLVSALASVTSGNNPTMPLAQAIDTYFRSFTFSCTGLTLAGIVPTPLPVPFPAQ